jgi:hypothetical protein
VAFAGGAILPILETIRRWQQLSDFRYFMYWFDDYIIGAFLLIAAFRTFKAKSNGRLLLIAAWGFATGVALPSLVSQFENLNNPDPGPASSLTVAIVKAFMLFICVVCLALSVKDGREQRLSN